MDPEQNTTTPSVEVNNVPPAQPPQQEMPEEPRSSGDIGPVIGIVIIIVLLIFGGLYFWGAQLNRQASNDAVSGFDASPADTAAPASDEPTQIEAELDAFDTTQFDAQLEADLSALEAEL